jgi:hypothetical protein
MSAISLPKVIDYGEVLETLPPDTISFQQVCNPVSGSSFSAGSQIDVDLGSRGFLVPDSLMVRFQMTTANVATSYMCGTPVYTPFLRLNTMINSINTETLNNYAVLANLLTNTGMDVAQKLGVQYAYGYQEGAVTPMTNENLDGGYFSANTSKPVSAPLPCALSFSEKLIPLFALNGIRLTFTLDSIANMFSLIDPTETAVALPTNFTITNFEVCYQCVDFGKDVENMVMSSGDIRIKSQTFGSSIQSVASGTSGQQNLVYNLKYSSIKSLFLNMGGATRTVSANGNLDSYDITTAGDYQFQLNGIMFPQRALSVLNNRAGILQMLRQAVGSIFDKNNSLSINTYEFLSQGSEGQTTSPTAPAKFWVGVATDKLRLAKGGYFSGVPSGSSPITAQINITTATTQAYNVMLIACADYIFKIDPMTRQVVIVS